MLVESSQRVLALETELVVAELLAELTGHVEQDLAELLATVARVDDDVLDAAVEAEIAPYLECMASAVGRSKALLRALGPVIDEAVVERTARALADTWETEEARSGIAAFLERRSR